MNIEQFGAGLQHGWDTHRRGLAALNEATADNRRQTQELMDGMVAAIVKATGKQATLKTEPDINVPNATYGVTYSISAESAQYPWSATLTFRGDGWTRHGGDNYNGPEIQVLLNNLAQSAYNHFKAPDRRRG